MTGNIGQHEQFYTELERIGIVGILYGHIYSFDNSFSYYFCMSAFYPNFQQLKSIDRGDIHKNNKEVLKMFLQKLKDSQLQNPVCQL